MGTASVTYDRRFELSVNDEVVIAEMEGRQFRVVFEILIDTGGFISYADIAITNMSADTANKFFKRGASLVFRAGYVDTIDKVFSGRIQNVFNERNGPDTVTRIIARGGSQPDQVSVEKTLGPGIRIVDVIRTCVAAMGYGIVIDESQFSNVPAYPRGYTLHGDPRVYLDELAQTHQFSYVLENERVVVNRNTGFRPGAPVVISQQTGMEGIPEITEVGVDVRTRLNPKVRIYGRVDIAAILRTFNFNNIYFQNIEEGAGRGIYRVFQLRHTGDSWGDDWSTQIVGYR